ncbi:MAG: succinyl-diaminopimelate desuccinylase [Alphaproteobacteria bacterium GM202ARS2]|nr:succinyl-diaminopimelate desuccinylase [Alphaproteobacteria bacterium GM202ARS2]
MTDVLELAQRLLRFRSVTPDDDGLYDWLVPWLESLGFRCYRHRFGREKGYYVDNLYARWRGSKSQRDGNKQACALAFAGHTDVVPSGDESQWRFPPFAAHVADGALFGRGTVDMKGGVACFLSACADFISTNGSKTDGSIGLLLTNDEEGEARYGMDPLLRWVDAEGYTPQLCVLGEPTAQKKVGDAYRSSRRGSLHMTIRVQGKSGHSAYPTTNRNPIELLMALVSQLKAPAVWQTAKGADSELPDIAVLSLQSGSEASNVTPELASAHVNVRFAAPYTSEQVRALLTSVSDKVVGRSSYQAEFHVSSEAFVSCQSNVVAWLCDTCEATLGYRPFEARGGGTSDARFIHQYCPVIELGLVGASMHQSNEACLVEDLHRLRDVYGALIHRFFDEGGVP